VDVSLLLSPVAIDGAPSPQGLRMRLLWHEAGKKTWLALASTIASRASYVRPSVVGAWTFWVVMAVIALAALAGAFALVRAAADRPASKPPATAQGSRLRRLRRWLRTVPLGLWIAMAVAVANAGAWMLITPTFQGPDEPEHIGYAEYVGETGKVPRNLGDDYIAAPDASLVNYRLPWSVEGRPSWSALNDRLLHEQLAGPVPRLSEAGAAYIASNPPLYYYLTAVPYRLASGGDFLDRVYAMRLLSVLLAGLTTGFVFLFLRELMPGTPWAWTIGALAVAFQPLFGFMGGTVNPENLLWTASAAMFWLLARSFRRGLTLRRGVAIAAVLAIGLFAKTSMAGVVPGVALALALLVLRSRERPRPLRIKAAALAIVVVPPIAWLLIQQLVFGRSFANTTEQYAGISHRNESITAAVDYLWQFYLPPLPFMHHGWFWGGRYPHYPLWQTYFQGFVGRFGWFAFGFPTWVSQVALAVALPVILLAGSLLVRARGIVRRRWPELVSYAAIVAGVLLLVGLVGYRVRAGGDSNFEQTRYLFALLPLYGALVAVAARAAGRRWGPVVAAVFLVLAIANSVFGQLLTVAHYFG
jgi:hypothetical protein